MIGPAWPASGARRASRIRPARPAGSGPAQTSMGLPGRGWTSRTATLHRPARLPELALQTRGNRRGTGRDLGKELTRPGGPRKGPEPAWGGTGGGGARSGVRGSNTPHEERTRPGQGTGHGLRLLAQEDACIAIRSCSVLVLGASKLRPRRLHSYPGARRAQARAVPRSAWGGADACDVPPRYAAGGTGYLVCLRL